MNLVECHGPLRRAVFSEFRATDATMARKQPRHPTICAGLIESYRTPSIWGPGSSLTQGVLLPRVGNGRAAGARPAAPTGWGWWTQ